MKQIIPNYTFSASGKTVTLTDFSTVRLDRLQLIVDTTTNKILYNFADSTVSSATISTNVVTLSALQGGEADTDKLQIVYDALATDPSYDTTPVGGNVASAATDSGSPVKIGGKYNTTMPTYSDGQRGNAEITSRGAVKVALYPDNSPNPVPAGADNADASAVSATSNKLQVIARNTVFNGTSFDRQRGDTTGTYVVGNAAGASADSGNPVKAGGVYNSTLPTYTTGQRSDAQVGSRGSLNTTLFVQDNSAPINVIATNSDGVATSSVASRLHTASMGMLYNGTSLDRARSSGPTGTTAVAGTFSEQSSLSAALLNADLVPSTDVSAYKWFSLQINGTWSGTLTFQGSNDNSNWTGVMVGNEGSTATIGQTTTGNGIFNGPVHYRYLRVRMTSYTSGTATGVLELYTAPSAMHINTVAQNGTWTQRLQDGFGNTISQVTPGDALSAAPTNVLGVANYNLLYDGTQEVRQRSSGPTGTAAVAGSFTEQSGLSAAALNADLVPSTDVSAYKWLSVQVGGTFSGTLTFQASNDNTTWVTYPLTSVTTQSGGLNNNTTGAGLFAGPVNFRYFRLRMTSYTSGTATGVLELYTQPSVNNGITALANQAGTWSVGANSATGSAIPSSAFAQGIANSAGNLAIPPGESTNSDARSTQSNGNVPQSIALGYGFNGSTFDRLRTVTSMSGSATSTGLLAVGAVVWDGSNYRRSLGDSSGNTATISRTATTGGATPYSYISTASTNATNIKSSAGTVYSMVVMNTSASAKYVKVYDSASAPTAGSGTPVKRFMVPAGGGFTWTLPPQGAAFASGIGFTATGGAADADTTSTAANDLLINVDYA